MIRKLIAVSLLLFSQLGLTQVESQKGIITPVDISSLKARSEVNIKASHFSVVSIDISRLRIVLKPAAHRDLVATNADITLELPFPDGTIHEYRVVQNSTLNPRLAALYPQIKTYDGYGLDGSGEFVKFDITPLGFHAMIMVPGKSPIFIDPYLKNDTRNYIVYKRKDFTATKNLRCSVTSQAYGYSNLNSHPSFGNFAACNLKTYRLAVAATAQYTQYFGGQKEDALAAQVTTINRVNGIYETDVAVTLQIIANNIDIIYTDPNNQPYTSGNNTALIDQNQVNLDAVIGSNFYDIGHVFDASTSGSGLAGLGVVCNGAEKGMGVTGQPNPVGDPFDVDYVAHEIGHQFGANHTQNNDCNRNDPTAVEPGSGSTIMGYAGICEPNVQANSNPYFNGINLQEIGNYVTAGGSCGVLTPIGAAPVITQPANIWLPISTPFSLTANATGEGQSGFTYTWEQMNNEISIQPPVSTAIDGPNFRSIPPTFNPTRYLPNLNALANGGPFTWEVLPAVGRTMSFRITVRRNQPGGSCNSYQDSLVFFNQASGPFTLLYPTTAGIQWLAGSRQTISWAVANTNIAPINAAVVDILLSTDGGITFPYFLSQALNDGAATITVPNVLTNSARIMVRAANRTFFTTSAQNFQIITSYPPPPLQAPTLVRAARNPLNKTAAFIYYSGVGSAAMDSLILNNLPGAQVTLDAANNRFVVSNIRTPRQATVSITVTRAGVSSTSNLITIPGIL